LEMFHPVAVRIIRPAKGKDRWLAGNPVARKN